MYGWEADVISRGVWVHQQPCCHMLLGGSVIQTEMPVSLSRHRGSRLASPAGDQEGSRVIATGPRLTQGLGEGSPTDVRRSSSRYLNVD